MKHQKSLIFFFILSLGLLGGIGFCQALDEPHDVFAQGTSDIKLVASAGFNGYCKKDNWIPIRVVVENSGQDVEARIQAEYGLGSKGDENIYAIDISLPSTSRKELFLYVFHRFYSDKLKVSVLSGGKPLAETTLKVSCGTEGLTHAGSMLVGLLSDNPSGYADLSDVRFEQAYTRVASLQISDLPDQVQGWDALDALVIAGVDTGQLTSAQRQALKLWVAGGGKLLIIGGPNWQLSTAGLGDLVPISVTGTRKISDFSSLQSYFKVSTPVEGDGLIAVGQVQKDALVLASAGNALPLLVEKPIGFGKVYYLAADPTLQPLSNWDGIQNLYNVLILSGSYTPAWSYRSWDVEMVNRALSVLEEISVPSVFFLCGWLFLYLAVIGPGNYLVLRRVKRMELAWLTIPVSVVVFTILVYVSGFMFRGTQPALNRLAVIQSWDGVEVGRVWSVVGIYSPFRAKFDFTSDPPYLLRPFDNVDNLTGASSGWLSYRRGNEIVAPNIPVEIGGMNSVALDGLIPVSSIKHDLSITLGSSLPMLNGSVTNTSGYTLNDAVIVTQGKMQELGSLAPNDSKQVSVSLEIPPDGPEFYNQYSWGYYPYSIDLNTEDDNIRRDMLLRAILQSGTGQDDGNWGIYLMGWLEEPVVPSSLSNQTHHSVDTVLYIAQLTPRVETAGNVQVVSPGLFIWASNEADISPFSFFFPSPGGYIFRFWPAIPVQIGEVENLTLHLEFGGVTYASVNAHVWDFERSAWQKIQNFNAPSINIPDPERYVGPGGEIRVKVSSGTNSYTEVRSVYFTLKVKP